jgi:hypothetical protein
MRLLILSFLCLQNIHLFAMYSSGTIDQLMHQDCCIEQLRTSKLYNDLVFECDEWLDRNVELSEARDLLKWKIRFKMAENASLADIAINEVTLKTADFIGACLQRKDIMEKNTSVYISSLLVECLNSVKETSRNHDVRKKVSDMLSSS